MKVYAIIFGFSISMTELCMRYLSTTFDEYPCEEVRRTYEFPLPLRQKYREVLGELDHDGKFVDPS